MHITLKLNTPIIQYTFQSEYSAVFRYAYKRINEGNNQKQIRALIKNIYNINSWLTQCAILDAQAQYDSHKSLGISKPIWGTKSNFKKRSIGKLSRNDWKESRLRPMNIQGEAIKKSNRLFDFSKLIDNIILYKPTKETKIEIPVRFSKNQLIQKQYLLSIIGKKPISVQLKKGQICLSYEQDKLPKTDRLNYRVLGIDMNPNYIGISIIDYKDNKEKLVTSRIYKWSDEARTNDNKRDHETKEIAHSIIKYANRYKVSTIGIENLTMGSKDNKKGRNFNKLVNNEWNRNNFEWLITKLCDTNNIILNNVNCAYSSTIGNILHPELPDAAAAAWEISRRAKYIYQKTLCMYPIFDIDDNRIRNRWKKDVFETFIGCENWVALHNQIKTAKLKYRNQLDSYVSAVRDLKSIKSGIRIYTNFIYLYS